ncbi:MAG: DinB family protein [Chloroflexota bacterium]
MDDLSSQLKAHWQDIRGRTYDLLDSLTDADLEKRLPFPTSQSLGTQFYCMLGTQESWGPVLTKGRMEGWSSSISEVAPEDIRSYQVEYSQRLRAADEQLFITLDAVEWAQTFDDGSTPLAKYLRLVEHEAHHQGQLINFIYALELPIPESWADSWGLSRDS